MKTFYLKITTVSKAFQYGIDFDENILARGQKGKGSYLCFKAKNRIELKKSIKKIDFSGLAGIVLNPIASE
ncbi:MAG: hypothetical protein WC264_01260 [Candidatus Paceibacterota bacterium]|jgi:hypothetical protein